MIVTHVNFHVMSGLHVVKNAHSMIGLHVEMTDQEMPLDHKHVKVKRLAEHALIPTDHVETTDQREMIDHLVIVQLGLKEVVKTRHLVVGKIVHHAEMTAVVIGHHAAMIATATIGHHAVLIDHAMTQHHAVLIDHAMTQHHVVGKIGHRAETTATATALHVA
jgi:acetyltransferase-like isoleucine patch superfamily enzyme